jgi:alpha-D-xyloside xylohydrolase
MRPQIRRESHYRELHAYATTKKQGDFVTMVRGWDTSYDFAPRTYARPEDAPVVWDGDNRRDWVGVADAMNTTLMNASLGYVVIGSDLGGYLDHDDQNAATKIPFDPLVFLRWTAMGALSPLMQLHSRSDYMPWTVPQDADEITADYRYWATLHHELVPFFYSLAQESYAKRASGIVRPVGDATTWPGDFRYMLGDAFLVAPILDATGTRDVTLPAGHSWFDWFKGGPAIPGGTTLQAYDATDHARYPLYVASGAIVPLHVDSDVVPVGVAASAGAWTILAYPSTAPSSFTLYEDDDTTTQLTAVAAGGSLQFGASRAVKPILVRLHADAAPTGATVNGAAAAQVADLATLAASSGAAWFDDTGTGSAWVRAPASAGALQVVVTTP